MALTNLRPSSRGITILIILAVVVFFGCVLAYMAAGGKLKSVATELRDKEKQVQDAEKIARTLEDSRLRFLDTRAQIRCLESSVSTQAYVPTLLKQLEHLGKSAGLRVLSVRPVPNTTATSVRKLSSGAQASQGDVEAASQQKSLPAGSSSQAVAKPYDELEVDLELEGSFASTLGFLYGLMSFPKIIAVDSVEMSPVGTALAHKSPTLGIRMRVTAFVLKDETASVEPDATGPSARGNTKAGEGRS